MQDTKKQSRNTHTLSTLVMFITAMSTSACSANVLQTAPPQPQHSITKENQLVSENRESQAKSQLNTYQLDPHHSNARFAINHMSTSTVTGGFYELTGEVKFSAREKTGYTKLIIPMNSLHTVSGQFTEHLKGKDFFDTATYPTAIFESTRWHFGNGENSNKVSKVEGNLTLHGKTKPVTLTATSFNCYFSPVVKRTMCGGDFTTVIDRTKWDINKYVLMGVPKTVVLDIEIEAIKQ